MGARAGTMSRGMASGRAGTRRLASPRLDEDEKAAATRAKQAEKDAKRAALAEKRAERAARKAEREAEKRDRKESRERPDEADETADAQGDDTGDECIDPPGGRPAAITVVQHAPGDEPEEPRR